MRSALMLGTALALGACNMTGHAQESDGGGGATAERDFEVGTFDRVSLAGSHDVIVTVGGAPSVRAEGDAKALERLEIRVEGGELKIGSKNHVGFSFKRTAPVKIHVTAPSLAGAAVAGSGNLKIDKVEGGRFSGNVAGSGDMEIASMKVDQAELNIGGSGGIRAAGTAVESTLSVAGSGDLRLEGLEVRRAKVDVAGSGGVRARAMETADVSLVGSGDVTLAGPAKCNVTKTGSGEVRCTG